MKPKRDARKSVPEDIAAAVEKWASKARTADGSAGDCSKAF
jgi:hypothetical protein